MNSLRKKLKSHSGASMVVALVCLLVCTLVGSVVLTAASVNAGRVERDRRAYQRRLAVASAVRLLTEDLEGVTFVGRYTVTDAVTTTVVTEIGPGGTPETTTNVTHEAPVRAMDSVSLTGGSHLLNGDALEQLFCACEGFSIEAPAASVTSLCIEANDAAGLPEVTGHLEIGVNYGLTAVLVDDQLGNRTELSFAPQISVPEIVGSTTTTREISPECSVTETVTVYAITVTWKNPLISRGDAG